MKLRNIWLGFKSQLPVKRFIRNFFITRNAWGLFHVNSHIVASTGRPKIQYRSNESASRAAASMKKKNGTHYSVYKCLFCDGYHVGRNRDNK